MSILQDVVDSILDLFSDLFFYSYIRQEATYWLGLAVVVLLGVLTFYFSRRLIRRQFPILRGIDGVFDLERNVETSAETGKAVHFSVGIGSLGDALTVQTLAGVDTLREISAKSALSGPPLVSTTSSALALPVLESTIRGAYAEASTKVGYQPENARFIAPTPVAYAAGVMRVLENEDVGLNVMVGAFADEYLLMGEAGARRGAKQLVATADPTVLPFVIATADYPVLGEELFALSAYLRPLPVRVGSIIAQDFVRLAIVALVLVSVVAVSLNPELRELVASWTSASSYP